MDIKIYHAIDPNFGFPTAERPRPFFPKNYQWVADVRCPGSDIEARLNVAYQVTNCISCDWTENPEVVAFRTIKVLDKEINKVKEMHPRSTSVGDVVEIDGQFFLCEMVGWKEFDPKAVQV
jgi:hypothetical protein